jgi:CHASE2 domain-containing sensor protein
MKKPLHKHIGQGVKKAGTHFTKYLYERDTIFATVWVFIFIGVLGSIPLNLGVLNPVKLGLKDFDFNDMSYSKLGKSAKTPVDTSVVIVNIGDADRFKLAAIIEKTAEMQPRAMGLDVIFEEFRDPSIDSMLSETFRRYPNLVLAGKFEEIRKDSVGLTHNVFLKDASKSGYVNFPNEDMESTRYFYPVKKGGDTVFPSFTTALLQLYDEKAYHKLVKKGDHKVMINYTRNITTKRKQYQVVEADQLLEDGVEERAIKGKIALLGYVNYDGYVNYNPNDIEDKKFTPMNSKFYGKTVPDMNGIVVHANILSMALENNYVKKLPSWVPWLVALLLGWLHMSFFIRYYLENHIWFHLVAKIAQVLSAIFFVWLGIYLFDRYQLKLDMKASLIVIIMAVDVIYFYEAWATWMHKKYGYRTVFKPHHH